MNIECILKREGGTRVTIETTEYHFAPLPDGAHVADVENDNHAQRFLGITEAYKIYRAGQTSAAQVETKQYANGTTATGPAPLPDEPPHSSVEMLIGSSVHDSQFDINGKSYTLGDVVSAAHAASGLTVEDWNSLPEDERHDLIDAELDKIQDGVSIACNNEDGLNDPEAERAELLAQYEAKFGKKAHPNTGIEKLRASLAAE